VIKPYYQDDFCQIFHGDCREILPQLPKVDLVLTDPPYGVDFDTDYRRFTSGFNVERKAHKPVANDDRPFDPSFLLSYPGVIMFGANCFSQRLPPGSWLIWDKRFANGKAFLADGEAAWMNKGHGCYIYTETSQGCIRSEPIEHPTQKPVGLMVWCLSKFPKAQTILDPFMGSGTTLVAAKQLGRKAVGIELEEKYCEIAVKRLQQEYLPLTIGQPNPEAKEVQLL
jgi:site-specific DNA-methyltransferase (adenine-specific)